MKTETRFEMVRVNLTKDELLILGKENADLITELGDLNKQKSAITSEFGTKIKQQELAVQSNARKIRDGFEMRNIECEVVSDYERKMVIYYEFGTQDVVKERKMNPGEMQMALALVEEGVA